MKFTKQFMQQNVAWGPSGGVTIVYDNIIDHTRWSVKHEVVFKFEGKYYKTYHSFAATECQSEDPYEYDDDMVEVTEVQPFYAIQTVYLDPTDEEVDVNCPNLLPVDGGTPPVLARLYVTDKPFGVDDGIDDRIFGIR